MNAFVHEYKFENILNLNQLDTIFSFYFVLIILLKYRKHKENIKTICLSSGKVNKLIKN